MKEHSRSSTDLFFPQALPTISFQQFTVKNVQKKKMFHFLYHYRETIGQCLAVMGVGALCLGGIYLFCIQLAAFGW